jgi:hypothetical protein
MGAFVLETIGIAGLHKYSIRSATLTIISKSRMERMHGKVA